MPANDLASGSAQGHVQVRTAFGTIKRHRARQREDFHVTRQALGLIRPSKPQACGGQAADAREHKGGAAVLALHGGLQRGAQVLAGGQADR